MAKHLQEEVIQQYSPAERILAHIQDGYELLDEDQPYLDKINQVFKLIHGEENRDVARRKVILLFGKGDHRKLIDDCTIIYGDFFVINRAAMRIIQEKRHERVYDAAMRAEDYASAERALKSIDALYRLDQKTDDQPTSNRRLPRTRRTNDPKALENLIDAKRN